MVIDLLFIFNLFLFFVPVSVDGLSFLLVGKRY